MSTMRSLMELYISFFKIGAFTIGGVYAMIPIMQSEIVDVHHWATDEEMTNFITLSQSVPGIISSSIATCVGHKICGLKGSIVAVLGALTPSIVVIIAIASVFDRFLEWTVMQNAFKSVRASVVALIIVAVIRLAKNLFDGPYNIIILFGSAIAILFFKISSPYVLLAVAAIALVYTQVTKREV